MNPVENLQWKTITIQNSPITTQTKSLLKHPKNLKEECLKVIQPKI